MEYLYITFILHITVCIRISFVGVIYCLFSSLEYKLNKDKDLFTNISSVSKVIPEKGIFSMNISQRNINTNLGLTLAIPLEAQIARFMDQVWLMLKSEVFKIIA